MSLLSALCLHLDSVYTTEKSGSQRACSASTVSLALHKALNLLAPLLDMHTHPHGAVVRYPPLVLRPGPPCPAHLGRADA